MEKPVYTLPARDYQPLHPALAGARLVPRRDVMRDVTLLVDYSFSE